MIIVTKDGRRLHPLRIGKQEFPALCKEIVCVEAHNVEQGCIKDGSPIRFPLRHQHIKHNNYAFRRFIRKKGNG